MRTTAGDEISAEPVRIPSFLIWLKHTQHLLFNHLSVCTVAALGTFTLLYNHHQNPSPNFFVISGKYSDPIEEQAPILPLETTPYFPFL